MESGVKNYDTVKSVEELRTLWDKMIAEGTPIGYDIETGYHGEDDDRGSLKQETNLLVGFSFTNSLNWARYCPLAHDFADNITDHGSVAEILWNGFQTGLIVAHNLGFELRRMARFFRENLSNHPIFGEAVRKAKGYFAARSCTQVEAYVRRETFKIRNKDGNLVPYREFALKELVEGTFGHRMIHFEELFDSLTEGKKKAFRFNILDLTPEVITYACEDALWCLNLHLRNYPVVKDQFIYNVDMQVTYVICDMEDCGIKYDWHFMQEASSRAKEFTVKLNDEIQDELAELLGKPGVKLNVNLGSPKQLSEILFDKLGLKVNVYTTSTKGAAKNEKKMSTGKEALEILAETNPVAKKISMYKNMKRLTTSFLDKYERDYGGMPDGNIHPSLNQSYVRTARFSSANPNQQNQPAVNLKDDDGSPLSYYYKLKNGESFKLNFRDSVIAPEDFYILGFDLSQAEYRAAAGLANETALIEAFENGEDVHTKVAAMMFRIPMEEVTKALRAKAKTLGFGLLFGMTASALAKKLNVSVEEAEELFAQYFAAFPKLKRWTEKQVQFGYEQGYVDTKFGRRIPIWELEDSRRWIREGGERACYNYPVQGGATGDYVRIAMVRARKVIYEAGLQDKIILFMNVHDALEYYVHRSLNPADVIALLQPAVIFPVSGWPMMKPDWHLGKRWGSVKEVEVFEDGSISIQGGPSLGTTYLPTLQEDLEQEDTQPTVSKQLSVHIQHMPTETQFDNFMKLVKKLEGSNSLELVTPEGTLEFDWTTGLDPVVHRDILSLALGGATVKEKASTAVDLTELASNIVF